MLVRDRVPATPQRFRSPLRLRSRTRSRPAPADGPGRFRQMQSPFGRCSRNAWRRRVEKWRKSGASPAAKACAASNNKWFCRTWKAGRSAACASFSRHCQSSRKIADVRPSIFPEPEMRQASSSSRTRCDGGLLKSALTRLSKPFQPAALPQICLQLLRKRQKVTRIVHRIFRHVPGQGSLRPIGFL